MQKSRDLLSTYETKLCQDDTVPEDPRAVDKKLQELSVSDQRKALKEQTSDGLFASNSPLTSELGLGPGFRSGIGVSGRLPGLSQPFLSEMPGICKISRS